MDDLNSLLQDWTSTVAGSSRLTLNVSVANIVLYQAEHEPSIISLARIGGART